MVRLRAQYMRTMGALWTHYGRIMGAIQAHYGRKKFFHGKFFTLQKFAMEKFLCAVGNISDTIIFKRYISPQVTEIYDFAGRNFE